jgi:hypothetical protein
VAVEHDEQLELRFAGGENKSPAILSRGVIRVLARLFVRLARDELVDGRERGSNRAIPSTESSVQARSAERAKDRDHATEPRKKPAV